MELEHQVVLRRVLHGERGDELAGYDKSILLTIMPNRGEDLCSRSVGKTKTAQDPLPDDDGQPPLPERACRVDWLESAYVAAGHGHPQFEPLVGRREIEPVAGQNIVV